MGSRIAIVALGLALAAVAARRPAATSADARRVLTSARCTQCHDSAVSKETPRALAVYDLHEDDWPSRMSDERLPKLLTRLKSAPKRDQQLVRSFIDAELRRRAGR